MFNCDLDAETVQARLELGDEFDAWLKDLASVEPPLVPVCLPAKHEVGDLLARLGVLPDDAADIIEAWPTPDHMPEIWWLLERCQQLLVIYMGNPSPPEYSRWKPLPAHLGTIGRLFYVYVFLATFAPVRQWHREHDIPDDVSWATLADLGEHIAIHRRIYGSVGLDTPDWLTVHFRGVLYRLGRLQFQRWRLFPNWPIDDSVSGSVPPRGTPAFDIHIPESGGSLTPEACDESFERARTFFARYFPEETYRFAQCISWLLDPQIAEYLPNSNIVRFQRRFHLVPGSYDSDHSMMRFVFRCITAPLEELPQRTKLERATIEHLRAGRHWQGHCGWLEL